MCSQQLSALHLMNNLLISKTYFLEFHSVFAFQKLLTCRSRIFVDSTRLSSSHETQRIRQNTHHHSLRER